MNVIREKGLRIPEDISVAGYDGLRIGRHIEPKLTTLRQDTDAIGEEAAKKLIDKANKNGGLDNISVVIIKTNCVNVSSLNIFVFSRTFSFVFLLIILKIIFSEI